MDDEGEKRPIPHNDTDAKEAGEEGAAASDANGRHARSARRPVRERAPLRVRLRPERRRLWPRRPWRLLHRQSHTVQARRAPGVGRRARPDRASAAHRSRRRPCAAASACPPASAR